MSIRFFMLILIIIPNLFLACANTESKTIKEETIVEVIKESHTWGHIPHRDRQPIELPKKYSSEIAKISEGSVFVMSPLTLHRTVKNKHAEPRIAFPVTVRNIYYPKTGNEDLQEYSKLNLSYYSKFRKILGNPYLSPFRTITHKRKKTRKKIKL